MNAIGDGSTTRDLVMPRGSFSDRRAYRKYGDRAWLELSVQAHYPSPLVSSRQIASPETRELAA
jgi:hypothetical protein